MNLPDYHDPLDALLGEQNTHIEDNGFTKRVLAALPARRPRAWLRPVLLLSVTGAGYVLALLWMPWHLLYTPALITFNSQTLLAFAVLLTVLASLTWGTVTALVGED